MYCTIYYWSHLNLTFSLEKNLITNSVPLLVIDLYSCLYLLESISVVYLLWNLSISSKSFNTLVHNYSVFLCNDFYFSKFGSTITPYISGSSTWSLSLSLSLSPWAIWLKVCQIYWYFEESSLASFIFSIVFSFLLQFFPLYYYFFLSTCFRFTLLFFSQCLIWNLRALIWDFWFLLFICLYCYQFPSDCCFSCTS